MNIGAVSSSYLQTTHQGHTAQGLQPNATPISQSESLTRVKSAQNTASAENRPNSNQENGSKSAEQAGINHRASAKNTNTYEKPTDKEHEADKESYTSESKDAKSTPENPQGLDEEALKEVRELTKRDREVRAHEAAHLAAAGQHAKGGVHLDMQRGPDGKSYAVGGHVSIDTSPVPNDPEATLRKARQIQAAAMAPAEPSSQDRAVAAEAAHMAVDAQAQIIEQRQQEYKENMDGSEPKEASEPEKKNTTSAAEAYEVVAGFGSTKNEAKPNEFHQVA